MGVAGPCRNVLLFGAALVVSKRGRRLELSPTSKQPTHLFVDTLALGVPAALSSSMR
jgi:hypothetical protein